LQVRVLPCVPFLLWKTRSRVNLHNAKK